MDFEFACKSIDSKTMEKATCAEMVLLFDGFNYPHKDIESKLRIFRQKIERSKRLLNIQSEKELCAFYLGMLFGQEKTIRWSLEEESKDQLIELKDFNDLDIKVLDSIYCKANGISHKDILLKLKINNEALYKSINKLTDVMAITFSNFADDIVYTITKAGKRYYERKYLFER